MHSTREYFGSLRKIPVKLHHHHLLSIGYSFCERHGLVVELFVLVHPDLGSTPGVFSKYLAGTPRKGIRMLVPEDMAHP